MSDGMPMPGVQQHARRNVHGQFSPSMRMPLGGKPPVKRRPRSVSVVGGRKKGGYLDGKIEDGRLDGDAAPRGEAYQHQRDLVAAVIRQAVFDMEEGHSLRGAQRPSDIRVRDAVKREALGWVMSPSPRAFGFIWSCVVLDQNPERVRAAILLRTAA